ncbi:MAG: hypothetical protein KBC22_02490 [Candidatus Pacebacteria bacterium]|nr:hypothetical protein [Candidatus Paceibacterota bacterium]
MFSQELYKKLLALTVISVWILLILQLFAMEFHLYWIFKWFDILMHGIGGIAVGFFMSALLVRFKPMLVSHYGLFILIVATGTVFVGLLWESLELLLDLYMRVPLHQPSVTDTIIDLVMDGVGAYIAGVLGVIIVKKYESITK